MVWWHWGSLGHVLVLSANVNRNKHQMHLHEQLIIKNLPMGKHPVYMIFWNGLLRSKMLSKISKIFLSFCIKVIIDIYYFTILTFFLTILSLYLFSLQRRIVKSYYLLIFLFCGGNPLNEKCNCQKSNCDPVLLTPFMTFPSWKHTVVVMYMTLYAVSLLSIISAASCISVHALCAIPIKNQLIKPMFYRFTCKVIKHYIRYIRKWLGSSFHYINATQSVQCIYSDQM